MGAVQVAIVASQRRVLAEVSLTLNVSQNQESNVISISSFLLNVTTHVMLSHRQD